MTVDDFRKNGKFEKMENWSSKNPSMIWHGHFKDNDKFCEDGEFGSKTDICQVFAQMSKAIEDEFLNAFVLYSKCGQVVISHLFA